MARQYLDKVHAMKKCTKCSRKKELSKFYTDKRASDGKTSACKKCLNKSALVYQQSESGKVAHARAVFAYRQTPAGKAMNLKSGYQIKIK